MRETECFEIKCGLQNMDFIKVTAMLSTSYWSKGIKIDEVRKGAEGSAIVLGVFDKNEQVGYARVISDKTRFGYISDVFVDENYRKKGIAQKMVAYILKCSELKDVYQWLLYTKDAHGVYSRLGFKALSSPEEWMQIKKERPEK
jgi:GNAT superfamily N-acetyltransferase